MSALPWFFGSAPNSRFAMVHWPEGPVRGSVVICPPLGYEAVCAHMALRELAERLAERGVVVVRVDYDGTGNSTGSDTDPDRVGEWRATVLECIDELVRRGFGEVALVGLRVGALVAADVAASPVVRHLVLWDPPTSGRRYVRALRLLAATGNVEVNGPELVVAGVTFPDEALAGLARLGDPIATATATTQQVLVVHPAEQGEPPEATGPVDVAVLPGTSALLDTTVEEAEMPVEIIDRITSWVAALGPEPLVPAPRPGTFESSTWETTSSGTVRHRAERVGAHGLFAVVTEPARSTGRFVVMLNNGAAPQIGPGRAWVEWARALADRGVTTIRADLAGLGDSPARPGAPAGQAYPETAGQDISDVVGFARGLGATEVVAVGLCSGALLAYDGLVAGAELDAVISVNGRFDKPWSDARRGSTRAGGRTPAWLAFPLSKSPLFPTFDRVPTWLWRLLDRLRLVASPAVALRQLDCGDVRALLVFGPDEWGLRALRQRSPREFEARSASPTVDLHVVPGLDHSMFTPNARSTVLGLVEEFLGSRMGWPGLAGQQGGRAVELRGPPTGP